MIVGWFIVKFFDAAGFCDGDLGTVVVVLTSIHVGVMDGLNLSIIVFATIESVVENRGLVLGPSDSIVMSLVKDGLKGLQVRLESTSGAVSRTS